MARRRDGEKGPDERGLKPSLATTTAKASERVIADPQAGNAKGSDDMGYGLFPALRGKRSRVSSMGRNVTRARRLYVSKTSKLRKSDPRYKTVHMKCAVSQIGSLPIVPCSLFQARDAVSHKRDVFT